MQMQEALVEAIAEFGSVAVHTVGAVFAAVAGTFVEMNGIQSLGMGDHVIGIWMALLGCVFLAVSYVLAGKSLQLYRQPAN